MNDHIRDIAEIACSETAGAVLNDISSHTKLPGLHMAIAVPGICHEHPPTTHLVQGCAYCERNGNVFHDSNDVMTNDATDVIKPYVAEIKATLCRLAKDIMQRVHHARHVDVSKTIVNDDSEFDLENMLLEALSDM